MSLKDTIARLFGLSAPAGGDATADVSPEAVNPVAVDGAAPADGSASRPGSGGEAETPVAEPDTVTAETSTTEDGVQPR